MSSYKTKKTLGDTDWFEYDRFGMFIHWGLYSMPARSIGDYTIPEGVATIAPQAFMKQCAITSVNIPASVTTIKSNAFYQCYSIEHIYCHSTNPATIDASSFEASVHKNCTLHVPKGYKEAYQNSSWSAFANIIDDLSSSSIENLPINDTFNDATFIYNLKGQRVTNPQKGQIYIIKNSNGKTHKRIYR